MSLNRIAVYLLAFFTLCFGSQVMAQDVLTCDDIEWSSVVTDEYPDISKACDDVVQRDGRLFARVKVELLRVRGNNLTFRVLNNDGTSGGAYTQNVGSSWRARIGGVSYRARDLMRGQRLNVYMPSDRWAIIHEDDDGPDIADAIPLEVAPELPKTASQLPLIGLLGAGLLLAGVRG